MLSLFIARFVSRKAATKPSNMECEVLVCRRPKLSLPFLPAGARAGGRRVCGMSVGPRAMRVLRLGTKKKKNS